MATLTENPKQVKSEKQAEALSRALTGQSWSNFPAIIQGFTSRGIPEDQISPRENVFTYAAWQALGRQVRKGEHGVKVLTYVNGQSKEKQDDGTEKVKAYSYPRTVSVFHISQTDTREEVA